MTPSDLQGHSSNYYVALNFSALLSRDVYAMLSIKKKDVC